MSRKPVLTAKFVSVMLTLGLVSGLSSQVSADVPDESFFVSLGESLETQLAIDELSREMSLYEPLLTDVSANVDRRPGIMEATAHEVSAATSPDASPELSDDASDSVSDRIVISQH